MCVWETLQLFWVVLKVGYVMLKLSIELYKLKLLFDTRHDSKHQATAKLHIYNNDRCRFERFSLWNGFHNIVHLYFQQTKDPPPLLTSPWILKENYIFMGMLHHLKYNYVYANKAKYILLPPLCLLILSSTSPSFLCYGFHWVLTYVLICVHCFFY